MYNRQYFGLSEQQYTNCASDNLHDINCVHIFYRHIDAVYAVHVANAEINCQYMLIKKFKKGYEGYFCVTEYFITLNLSIRIVF